MFYERGGAGGGKQILNGLELDPKGFEDGSQRFRINGFLKERKIKTRTGCCPEGVI